MPTRRRRIRLAAVLTAGTLLALAASTASSGSAVAAPGGSALRQDGNEGHDHVHGHGPDGLALDRRGRVRATAPGAPYAVDAHAAWNAAQWDGGRFTTDQADLADRAGDPQVHAVYVHPAKTVSRFLTFAAMFQADARQASALLETTRGRAIRWDLRVGANGGQYLDITVFQSRYRAQQLAGGNQFSLVANELAASGRFSSPNKKYVVWLDAGSAYCGQGTLYTDASRTQTNANNVQRTTGIVYRPYPTNDSTTGGFCRGRTLLHELGHNLGAVQPSAPNDFDGAHCDDSAEDVMCYTAQAEARLGVAAADTGDAVFDHGSDDYWDPPSPSAPLGWWTINLSRFLCADATTC